MQVCDGVVLLSGRASILPLVLSDRERSDVVVALVAFDGLSPEAVVERAAAGIGEVEPFAVTVAEVEQFAAAAAREDDEFAEAFDADPAKAVEDAAVEAAREAALRLRTAQRRARICRPEDDRHLKWALAHFRSAAAALKVVGRSAARGSDDSTEDGGVGGDRARGDGLSPELRRLLEQHDQEKVTNGNHG